MKVESIMTPGIVAVSPDTPVIDAARLMLEKRISGMPVVEGDGRLVGVFTEGDLLRRTELGTDHRNGGWIEFLFGSGRRATDYAHTHGVRVEEVMTRHPLTCRASDDLRTVIEVMIERAIKRLIVVADGRPIGIVSRADVVRAFLEAALERAKADAPASEAETQDRIRVALKAETWVPHRTMDAEVRNGKVILSGTLTDARQREAIRVVVEREAPGFAIVDHMVWIEPYSGNVMEVPE